MRCGKLIVEVPKSNEETIPTEIFEHELRIVRALYAVRVVGRVVDAKGKRRTFPLGTPEEEFERLKARYSNVGPDGGGGLNAAELAYSKDPAALGEAMRAGVGDEEVRGAAAAEEEEPPAPREDYWSAEQWQDFMTWQGIAGWKKSWGAYQLRNLALEQVALRGAKVGVTLDDMRCDDDVRAKVSEIEVAEEREEKTAAEQRRKAQAANA